ncbi:MAG: 30S ribosomal protein S16 [Bernardetiaceae bacterium]|nr:30S ribosomal protein S16 [Bernardetiaceae bacterium]
MAVKIRLARRGRKKAPVYDIVVADSRAPRDGKFIEKIGLYNPLTNPATVELNEASALKWVMEGAQPTDTTRTLLRDKGVMLRKHLQVGVNKGSITQETADAKFSTWKNERENRLQSAITGLVSKKAADAKARLAEEVKKKEAKAAAIAQKKVVAEPVAEAPASESEPEAEA